MRIPLSRSLEIKEMAVQAHEISNNVVCATSKASDRPAHTRSLDSSVGRAPAFGAGGQGFESRGRTIPKG